MSDQNEREALAERLHYALRRDDWGVANDDERAEMLEAADALIAAGYGKLPDAEWEYGTLRPVTDGWETGDRYGAGQYVDRRSVTDNLLLDPSTVTKERDLARTVRRRKAGPWERIEKEASA